jgi:4-hydroxybenzoate polyprenyltransferase
VFLSLALVKRYAELHELAQTGTAQSLPGRGYGTGDLRMITLLGLGSGLLSVAVLALYLLDTSTTVLYQHPLRLWAACGLLLFWMSRTWYLTRRGDMHDDPVVFALTDYTSLLTGLLFCATFWWAT